MWDGFDLEGTTLDPSVLQETSLIRGSLQARTNVSGEHSVGPQKEQLMTEMLSKHALTDQPYLQILSQNQ
jgi:hypothetical protein